MSHPSSKIQPMYDTIRKPTWKIIWIIWFLLKPPICESSNETKWKINKSQNEDTNLHRYNCFKTNIFFLFQVVHVEWNDAPIAAYINQYRGRVCRMLVEYTLEIVPNSEAPIKSKMYADDTSFILKCLGPKNSDREWKYKETFYGVELGKSPQKESIK